MKKQLPVSSGKVDRQFQAVFEQLAAHAGKLSYPVKRFDHLANVIGDEPISVGRLKLKVSQLRGLLPGDAFPIASAAELRSRPAWFRQRRVPSVLTSSSKGATPVPGKPAATRSSRSSRSPGKHAIGGFQNITNNPALGGAVASGSLNVVADWTWWNQSQGQVLWTFDNISSEQRSVILLRGGSSGGIIDVSPYYFGGAFWPIYIQEGFPWMTQQSSLGYNLFGPDYQSAPLALVHFGGQAYIVAFIFTLDPGEVWGTVETGFNGVGNQPSQPADPVVVEVQPEGPSRQFCVSFNPAQVASFGLTASSIGTGAQSGYSPNPKSFNILPFAPVLGQIAGPGGPPYVQLFPSNVAQPGVCGNHPMWQPWESLGDPPGEVITGVGACSWAANRLDAFATGTDDALWHLWYNGSWQPWESLGGNLTSDPAAVSWSPGVIDVFARGPDLALRHIWFDKKGWRGWLSLGAPASTAWNGQPMWINTDPWTNLTPPAGCGLLSHPAVASWGKDRLDVFVFAQTPANRGVNLWQLTYDDGWSANWNNLGQPPGDIFAGGTSPAAVSWGKNRIDIVALGEDGLWHLAYDGQWGAWENLFQTVVPPIVEFQPGSPAISSWGSERLDIFCAIQPIGNLPNSAIWHLWMDSGVWQHWESLGGQVASDPTAVSWQPQRVDLFACGPTLDLQHLWFG